MNKQLLLNFIKTLEIYEIVPSYLKMSLSQSPHFFEDSVKPTQHSSNPRKYQHTGKAVIANGLISSKNRYRYSPSSINGSEKVKTIKKIK